MYIDAESLGIIICKVAAMEDLQLAWINLTEGAWPMVLEAIQKLKELRHLHLMYLHEAERKACFLKANEEDGANQNAPVGFNDFFGPQDYDALSDDDEDEEDYGGEDVEDEEEDDDDEYDSEDDDSIPDLESLPGADTQTSTVNTDAGPASNADEKPPFFEVQNNPSMPWSTEPAPPPPSASDTDDSPPDVEPQASAAQSSDIPSPLLSSTIPAPPFPVQSYNHHGANNTNHTTHTTTDHAPPEAQPFGYGEQRGHYICLSGSKEIREQLPTFIKEYNLLDDNDDYLNGMPPPPAGNAGAAGGAGGMNAIINSLGAAFGMQPTNVFGNAHGGAATFVGPGPAGGGGGGQTVAIGIGNTVIGGFTLPGGMPPPPPQGANGTAGAQGVGQANAGAGAEDSEESELSTDEE